MSADPPVFLRVEKGTADLVELGVLAALLRLRSRQAPAKPASLAAHWRRPERQPGFADPRAWPNTPS
ncbi:acyl-CoA carboxylase subunit epsilon [Kibdelosporangium aridum]|uniref:Acyl-CoA carboxylase subunit epsilon n=1 Tax=Kibdelosporangium aridum TaxID=2030 RepID=A0A428ZCH4_KIBAR|nr:acyl-CoA carboxylase epsilon subunit [Kibdelosporangium aridum]RSM85670.1 acyl-CoA carboxylase subunit epsilon [Kibdelosporangium aridum]